MDYQGMKDFIISEFEKNEYRKLVKQNKRNSKSVKLTELKNKSAFYAYYPGYKARITARGTYYDYRVDIIKGKKQVTLSHVNIIVDLYQKVFRNNELKDDLIKMLGNIITQGDIDPLNKTNLLSMYMPGNSTSKETMQILHKIHEEIGKKYNSEGNQWDFEIEELYTAIGWIALQEDVNYPQEKGYEGRRMPFSRYLEAIQYAAEEKQIKTIIWRALSHGRPKNLKDVDYSIIR
jgi:hypothetical protein